MALRLTSMHVMDDEENENKRNGLSGVNRLKAMKEEQEDVPQPAANRNEPETEPTGVARLQALKNGQKQTTVTPAPETPSAVPASPAEPAAQQGRIRPGWDTADAAGASEAQDRREKPFTAAADNLRRLNDAAGVNIDDLREDLTQRAAERDAADSALGQIVEPWNRANATAQNLRSQVAAYETKLGMLQDTMDNSDDPEERRRAQQESQALDLYYQKAQRAAERYESRFNDLNTQFQQLAIARNKANRALETGMEQYDTLLSLGDKRAANYEQQARDLRDWYNAAYQSGMPNAWELQRQAENAEAKAAAERQNYAEYLAKTKGEGYASRYLQGIEDGNRAKAEKASFGEKVLNTVAGLGENFFSGVGGAPWIFMARLMEIPEDALYALTGNEAFNQDAPGRGPRTSQILQTNDPFRSDAETRKQRAGSLGGMLIDTGYAAGNMLGMTGLAGQVTGALSNTALMSKLSSIAESSTLATSPAARRGAQMAINALRSPGNLGVSLSSGVSSYSEALANGASFSQAMANGISKAVTEYVSNRLFSGMPLENAPGEKGYVTKAIEFLADKLGKSEALAAFNRTTGGKVLGWIYDKAGEGLEEVVTGLLDPIIDRMTYDKEADWLPKLDQLADEFLGGMMLSLLMSGGEAVLAPSMTRAQIAEDLVRQGVPKAEARKYAGMIYKDMKAAERAQKAVQEAAEAAAVPVEAAANENTPPVPGAVQENGPPVPQGVQNAPQTEQTAENAPPVPGEAQNAAETPGTAQGTEAIPQAAAETAESPTGRARPEAAMASEGQNTGEAPPHTEGLRLPTAQETSAPAPERVNLLANNGTEGTNNGTAAAENTGADISDRNGRRGPGERTRREAAKLARETKEWRALPQQDKAAGRQAHADDLQLEAVDARSLGVTSAAAESTVRVYPRSEWEPDLQRIAARVEKATGQNVTFVLGQIRVDNNGKPMSVRGVNTGRGIIVQADALGVSAEKIATHEAYHSFSRMDPALSARVLKQIRKDFPENRLRQIAETYLAKMNGIVDLESTDQAVLARALEQVREEICADAYAGINAFAAKADEYTEPTRKAVSESRNRQTAEATERTTGPPDAQYSVSDSDAEYMAAVEAGDMETYNRTALVTEDTVDKWLKDYAAKSSPKYAQAYITRMTPKQFVDLTTSTTGRLLIGNQTGALDAEKLIEATRDQPLQIRISDGEVIGHEGRHRATALSRAGVESIPVLVFDSSNKYSKTDVPEMTLQGQDFGHTRSYATETLRDLIPLSYENRDRIVQEYGTQPATERMQEKYNGQNTIRFSTADDEEYIPESAAEYGQMKRQGKVKAPKIRRPVSRSRATIAKADLKKNLLGMYSIPAGSKAELGTMIDALADRYIREGTIDENDRRELLDKLYASGVVFQEADDSFQAVRDMVRNGRIYVSDKAKTNWQDTDYNDFRRQAMAEGIYLVNDETARGWDSWNAELAEAFPGIFDANEYDPRTALERIVQVAREGRGEKLSLAEYAAQMAGVEYATEDDMMDNLERQADYALRTFGEKANLEIYLKDRTGRMIAQERQRMGELRDQAVQKERERGDKRVEAAKEWGQELLSQERAREIKRRQQEREHRKEVAQRLRERQNMRELQQKTLKQLQWLSKNRNKFPGDLQGEVNKILEDIDIYAASIAEEMHIDRKTGKTWKELRDIYEAAKKNDPNFMPSAELERIVARLDYKKIGDLDIGALNDLYKAAVGLRTELYNRNNMIEDELHSTFAEVYDAVKEEMQETPGGYQTGVKGLIDTFMSEAQLTPMNRFQRMAGWNPNSRWYGMAKMLEKGEREQRRFQTEAAKQLAPVLEQYEDWARRADGQGKNATWYEIKVPESWEYHMGDKPVFSDKTVTVYMTPAQKVHMYLESKNLDNLRHMEGGRTFADKELYSKGKRAEAFAQGTTVKLLPETVKNIVSDLTEEEQALANALEAFYNNYSKQEINRVSNILYGYDKAMGGYYAPIYTNNNYTKSEPGIFDLTAEGVGNLKSRTVSANPSLNLSAFDAFAKSVDKTGRFVGLSIPIRNLNTLMNWREQGNSTKEILDHKWGEKTTQWVEDLMTELQSGKERDNSIIETLTNTALSKYISSVFGANPSIVAKQFASHPLAATYLKWDNLLRGLMHVGQADPELISKYTGELDYRMLGYATPETAQIKDNPGILLRKGPINFLFGGGAITWMDGFTVRSLWSASEEKVSREQPDLEIGTQEQINAGQSPYYQAVAREFEEAVSRSQPMYDTMHRSDIMRETNPITRAFTLFKTVPQQEYNMLRQTVGEAAYYKRIGADAETQAEARQKAGRAFAGILIGNLMIDIVTFLNALWKNKGKKFRDEDGKITAQSVAAGLAKQYIRDAAGLAIGGDVAADVLSSILFGDKWYGLEMPGLEQLGSILEQSVNAGKTVQKLVADSIDILQNGGDWGQYMADHKEEYINAVDQIVSILATYGTGLPIENVKAYLLGGVQWISPQIKTAYDDLMKKADKSGLKGLKGASLETRTMHIFQDRAGDADASTVGTIAGLYAAGYTDAVPAAIAGSYTINGETRSLNAADEQQYSAAWQDAVSGTLDRITRDVNFRAADQQTQAKALNTLYDLATQEAKAAVWPDYEPDAYIQTAKDLERDAGIPLEEWLPIRTVIGTFTTERDASGKEIRGKSKKDKVAQYINGLKQYSRDQKDALWAAAGYKNPEDTAWHGGSSGRGKTYSMGGLRLPTPERREPISSGLRLPSTPAAKPSSGGLRLK